MTRGVGVKSFRNTVNKDNSVIDSYSWQLSNKDLLNKLKCAQIKCSQKSTKCKQAKYSQKSTKKRIITKNIMKKIL